ncbi:MAG: hypothetical protein WBP94_02320 [Rhodomicrobiaceae bacterium]
MKIWIIAAILSFAFSAQAQNTQQNLKLSSDPHRLMMIAFKCSIYASLAAEQERLFKIGLSAGRKFYETRKDDYGFILNFANIDFLVGTSYETSRRLTEELVTKDNADSAAQIQRAKLLYKQDNCALIKTEAEP